MSERSEGYSDGYAYGLRWGKRDGDRIAAETLREPHRVQADRDRLTAALDVDELARVLHDAECTCDRTTHTPQWWENRERSARAVVAHLTKGNENDE